MHWAPSNNPAAATAPLTTTSTAGKRRRTDTDEDNKPDLMDVVEYDVVWAVSSSRPASPRNNKRLRCASPNSDAWETSGETGSVASSAPLTPVDWPGPSHVAIADNTVYYGMNGGERPSTASPILSETSWQQVLQEDNERAWEQRQLELELDAAALTAWHVYSSRNRILNQAYQIRNLRASQVAASEQTNRSHTDEHQTQHMTTPETHYAVMNALLAQLHRSRMQQRQSMTQE
jgi:hypothetical protein